MAPLAIFILCLYAFSAVSGSHMQGGLMTFRPRGKNPDGSLTVDFKYKGASKDLYDYMYWSCMWGHCGSDIYRTSGLVDESWHPHMWYQLEGYFVRHVYSDKPFQLRESSCCWVDNKVGAMHWSLTTTVDLGTRSDTFMPNHSPVTTILPVLRVPQGCPSSFKLLAHDPDGDIVQCRYGSYSTGECGTCLQPPNFHLDQDNCVLTMASGVYIGSYVFELVLQDFPQRDIHLTYSDGSVSYKYRPYVRKSREAAENARWYTYSFTDTTADSSFPTETHSVTLHDTTLPYTMDHTVPVFERSSAGSTPEETTWERLESTIHIIPQTTVFTTHDHRESTILQDTTWDRPENTRYTPEFPTSIADVITDIPGLPGENSSKVVSNTYETRIPTSDEIATGQEMTEVVSITNHDSTHVSEVSTGAFPESTYQPTHHVSEVSTGAFPQSTYQSTHHVSEVSTEAFPESTYQSTHHVSEVSTRAFPESTYQSTHHVSEVSTGAFPESTYQSTHHVSEVSTEAFPESTYQSTHHVSEVSTGAFPESTYQSTHHVSEVSTRAFPESTYQSTHHVSEVSTGAFPESTYQSTHHVSEVSTGAFPESTYQSTHHVSEVSTGAFPQSTYQSTHHVSEVSTGAFPESTYRSTHHVSEVSTGSFPKSTYQSTHHVSEVSTGVFPESTYQSTHHVSEVSTGSFPKSTYQSTHHVSEVSTGVFPESTYQSTHHVSEVSTGAFPQSTYQSTHHVSEVSTGAFPESTYRSTHHVSEVSTGSFPESTYQSTHHVSEVSTGVFPESTYQSTHHVSGASTGAFPQSTYQSTHHVSEASMGAYPESTYQSTHHVSEVSTGAVPESTYQSTTESVTLPKTPSNPSTNPWITTVIYESTYSAYDPNLHSLSKIPLQFVVEVTAPISNCDYGVFRPKLITPTPKQGETMHARAGTPFQLHLSAEVTHDRISDFKVSGPANFTKRFTSNTTTSRSMTVEWITSENDIGDHVPFCFFAETVQWHSSELRCVVVIVDSKFLDTSLTCNENTMTLLIKKSSSNGLYDNHLRLNDPACLLSSNNTHHIASVGFSSCGTEVEETEHEIVFKNTVTSFDSSTAVISRKHQVIIPFNCSFPKENRVSASFHAQKAVFEFTEAGFGSFTYKFQFYTDDRFVTVQTQTPLEVWLRDMVYMEIAVTSSVPNVQLFVESCRATPHDNPNDPVFYSIIDNGCLKDETLVVYPRTWTQSRFGMEAFAFIGNYEEVYLSCTVILCKSGDPNTRCSRGCVTKSSAEPEAPRRKRTLTPESTESLQHFISQGPLRMMRQSSSRDSGGKATLNLNTAVVSLSAVIAIALAATTIIIYMKKAKMNQYKKLPTEEL